MRTITPEYSFTMLQEGSYTKFVYKKTPLSYKAIGPMCINCILPAMYLTYISGPQTIMSVGVTFFIMLLGCSALVITIINLFRRTGEFKLNKEQLIINDNAYQLNHVSNFVIKDPNGGYIESVVTVHTSHNPFSVGSNIGKMQNELQNMGRQSRAALKQHFRNVSYKLVIRYASKEVTVASGLGEVEAESLLEKVAEISGYQ